MKRFELWLTTVIMFSLPALVFAQATGGSPGKLLEHNGGTSTGRKGIVQAEIRKKGTGNAQKKTGTLNPQPLPPINHAPLAEKGSGNAPKTTGTTTLGKRAGGEQESMGKTTGTTTPPPKAGKLAGKVYRQGSGTGRKGKVEQTDADKKGFKGAAQTQK